MIVPCNIKPTFQGFFPYFFIALHTDFSQKNDKFHQISRFFSEKWPFSQAKHLWFPSTDSRPVAVPSAGRGSSSSSLAQSAANALWSNDVLAPPRKRIWKNHGNRTCRHHMYIYIYTYIRTYVHTLHYITLHDMTWHYITLHYITLHNIT